MNGDSPSAREITGDELMHRYRLGERDFAGLTIVANLAGAYLSRCDFSRATFRGNTLTGLMFHECKLRRTTFELSRLHRCTLRHSDLSRVSVRHSELIDCYIEDCDFSRANFSRVDFDSSELVLSDFESAELSKVTFYSVVLTNCKFDHLGLANVTFVQTGFGEISRARKINFLGFCTVDWQSVCLSLRADGTRDFLAKSGMPDLFVEYTLECAQSLDPKRLFSLMQSTFISYGAPDTTFARRLRRALHENGVTTFFFETDSVPGERVHRFMHRGVNTNDRTLLICSHTSLDRSGVLNELEEVFAREAREGGITLLIPITIDDYVFEWHPDRSDLAIRLRERVVADFRGAEEDPEVFHRALQRLLRALRPSGEVQRKES